jgi:hypothetical protein
VTGVGEVGSNVATDEEREGGRGQGEFIKADRRGGSPGAAAEGERRRVDEPPDILLRLPRLLPAHHPPDPALQVSNNPPIFLPRASTVDFSNNSPNLSRNSKNKSIGITVILVASSAYLLRARSIVQS